MSTDSKTISCHRCWFCHTRSEPVYDHESMCTTRGCEASCITPACTSCWNKGQEPYRCSECSERESKMAETVEGDKPRKKRALDSLSEPKKHKTKQCAFCKSTEDVHGMMKCCVDHAVCNKCQEAWFNDHEALQCGTCGKDIKYHEEDDDQIEDLENALRRLAEVQARHDELKAALESMSRKCATKDDIISGFKDMCRLLNTDYSKVYEGACKGCNNATEDCDCK